MDIKLNTIFSGFDYKSCWVIPTIAATEDNSLWVLSMTKLDLTGSDVFDGSYFSFSRDQGKSWTSPKQHEIFAREPNEYGGTTCRVIFPTYHRNTEQVIGFGNTVNYTSKNEVDRIHNRISTISFLEQDFLIWTSPCDIPFPNFMKRGNAIVSQVGNQFVELPDGSLIIPVAISPLPDMLTLVYVVKMRISGHSAEIIEIGNEIMAKQPRGLGEPSLIKFRDKYFLTMRNDIAGYVAYSNDGLNYSGFKPWCFDDGELLGNYSTQQRWVRNGDDELYLIYNRRNANNDNVFRHRAPVMIARVDIEKQCVIRSSEQILIPNRGARMGNFMATEITPGRSLFTVAEWMQNDDIGFGKSGAEFCASFGSDNSVFIADIKW